MPRCNGDHSGDVAIGSWCEVCKVRQAEYHGRAENKPRCLGYCRECVPEEFLRARDAMNEMEA